MIYKRCCFNPECAKVFSTIKHNQYYCSRECRISYWESYRINIRNKQKRMLKCRECGDVFFGPASQKYCSANCEKNHNLRLETLKLCKKCIYHIKGDIIPCHYFFITGKLRQAKEYYPCLEFKEKRKSNEREAMVDESE